MGNSALAAHFQLRGEIMNKRYILIFSLLFIVVAPIAILFSLSRIDVSSVRYANYEEARLSGAIGKWKWLPGDISSTAREIIETHDVDTNEIWFLYRDKAKNFSSNCREVNPKSVRIPRKIRHAEVDSFIERLTGLMESGRGKYYTCRGEEYDYFLAIDSASDQVLGWSNGGN